MRELSLFTGAGGGILGSKILGWKTIGYVEKDEYCQKVIAQRIKDGIFDDAPIFADIKLFNQQGFANAYCGFVDVVTAGFPCQPFSIAGKRKAQMDERNLWPETIATISAVRPKFVFLENVPGLLSTNYFWKIIGDLWESGYDARWDVVSAADIGANHKRKRLWIFCWDTNSRGWNKRQKPKMEKRKNPESTRVCENVANSNGKRLQEQRSVRSKTGFSKSESCGDFRGWWELEPAVGRVAHGVAKRTHRLRAIGNGQVPLQMAYAFSKLSEGIIG